MSEKSADNYLVTGVDQVGNPIFLRLEVRKPPRGEIFAPPLRLHVKQHGNYVGKIAFRVFSRLNEEPEFPTGIGVGEIRNEPPRNADPYRRDRLAKSWHSPTDANPVGFFCNLRFKIGSDAQFGVYPMFVEACDHWDGSDFKQKRMTYLPLVIAKHAVPAYKIHSSDVSRKPLGKIDFSRESAPFSIKVNPPPSEGFLWGFQQVCGTRSFYPWLDLPLEDRLEYTIIDAKGANVGWIRWYLIWADVENYVSVERFKTYGLSDYPTVEKVSDQMIDDYAWNRTAWRGEYSNKWAPWDIIVSSLSDNAIGSLIVVGHNDDWAVPYIEGTKAKISPDRIGREKYLGLAYLHARACVRRYGPRVQYWILEDELNSAYVRGVRWYRCREGDCWKDEDFKNSLMLTLGKAVKEEGRRLGLKMYTAHNFMTFLPADVPGKTWIDYAKAWARGSPISGKYGLDIIGLDIYPNSYSVGFIPELTATIDSQINMTVDALRDASFKVGTDVFVWVTEANFPSAPKERGYDESGQAKAIVAAIRGAQPWGSGILGTDATGFIWGALTGGEGRVSWWFPEAPDQHMGIVKSHGTDRRKTDGYYELRDAIARSGKIPLKYPSG